MRILSRALTRRVARAAALTVAASAALTLLAAPASAAPTSKGTTTVALNEETFALVQGLTGPAKLTPAGAVFGIVGNPGSGVIKHVGGIVIAELDPSTPAETLTLSNFWINTKTGTVSALVNDSVRADVFEVGEGLALSFTSAASQAVTGSSTAIAGAPAGTAVIDLK